MAKKVSEVENRDFHTDWFSRGRAIVWIVLAIFAWAALVATGSLFHSGFDFKRSLMILLPTILLAACWITLVYSRSKGK